MKFGFDDIIKKKTQTYGVSQTTDAGRSNFAINSKQNLIHIFKSLDRPLTNTTLGFHSICFRIERTNLHSMPEHKRFQRTDFSLKKNFECSHLSKLLRYQVQGSMMTLTITWSVSGLTFLCRFNQTESFACQVVTGFHLRTTKYSPATDPTNAKTLPSTVNFVIISYCIISAKEFKFSK